MIFQASQRRKSYPERYTFADTPSAGGAAARLLFLFPGERPLMRTALYVRVSTLQQKPDLQHDGLRAYAARTGLEIVADYSPTATLIGKSFNFNEI